MNMQEKRRNKWVFQILTGKKPEETSIVIDKYFFMEAKEFYRRIKMVKVQEDLQKDYAEKVLETNYYIGMQVYLYIMKKYVQTESVSIYLYKNDQLRIRTLTCNGKIFILIPNLLDEDF